MLRKYFRRVLPHHDQVRNHNAVRWLGPWLHHPNLWHLNRHSVAGGVAVGLFTGLIPGPVQMLLGAIFAIVFRVNLPVAVLTTLYTNPFTFVPLYMAAYQLGKLVYPAPDGRTDFHFDWQEQSLLDFFPVLFSWLASLGPTFVIGLLLLASMLSVGGYLVVRGLWRAGVLLQWQRRRKRRARSMSS